ncbi:MAG: class I SAM-dependent methyltransferase, partial [Acidobacteriota bacterium]
PGVVIDRFGPAAVVQLTGAGADRYRAAIVRGLEEVLGEAVPSAWERSDVAARRQEGLEPRVGPLWGPEPPREIEIEEDGRRFLVDVRAGHKTGFYLDQRGNRSLMRDLMAAQSRERSAADAGPRALDAFCYTGGFSLALLAGGAASVVQLDASESALTLARRHVELAGYASEERAPQVLGNAFGELRRLRAENRRFDFIVLDPPKFADTKARVARASRGYKDINLLAFQLLAPGGLLATFSCSGRVLPELFQKIVADAALDAGREARILHRLGAGADHPVALAFPEGLYLKGLVCRVD